MPLPSPPQLPDSRRADPEESGAERPASAHEQRDRHLFDSIAPRYLRKDLLPASRIARRARLVRTLAQVPADRDIDLLEVGCGAGFSARYLAGGYRRFVGLDYSGQLIAYAREHNLLPGVEFVAANARDYEPAEPFDVVLMIGVLHHFDEMTETLRRLVPRLRPGGWLVANEPQPANPLIRLARSLRKRVDREYSDEQLQLSADELRAAYEAAGLVDVRVSPQGLFSTPFAEVAMAPQLVARPLASFACAVDAALERLVPGLLRRLSWNLVAVGRRPAG